jgi:uncharacterized membrane protein YjgN (DUF898 family)
MELLFVLAENDDTLLTGFSGVVILVIVVWLVMRAMRKRSG